MPARSSATIRVVSLVPSATEILCELGGRGLLVGRSHECDHPPGVERLPAVCAPTMPSVAEGADCRSIDERVRQAMAERLPLYTLDLQMLESLKPDVILTQDLCEVCTIDRASVAKAASRVGARIIALKAETIEGVLDDALLLGREVGLESQAIATIAAWRERLFAAQERVDPYADGPNVAFLEWTDPPFVAGHWTVQMIERAGGRLPLNPTSPVARAGAAAGPMQAERRAGKGRRLTMDELVESSPDRLIIAPCGLTLDQSMRAWREMSRDLRVWQLECVRAGRVAIVDGNQMFNRPGPRLIDAFEWLVGWLQGRPEMTPADFPWALAD
ncbi:MAG: hypothetical protein IPK69_08945 [Phycisphaerales bacterium]|nr:MAG: hypothetical protein IPK69_08945 [Phycisphaerales bacterium]